MSLKNERLILSVSILVAFSTPSGALEPVAELVTNEGFYGEVFWSVDADGNVVVAGVPNARTPGGGVGEGAVYVFRRTSGKWSQDAKLFASTPIEEEYMGSAVAIAGDVLVAGAPYSTTFQPDGIGQAYVFRKLGNVWVQEQILVPSLSHDGDNFGAGTAMDGERVVVGAPDFGTNPGRAFVFRWDGLVWTEEGMLIPTDLTPEDDFGSELAMRADTALVGVSGHNIPFADAGAVYAFHYDGDSWTEEAKLTATDAAAGDAFGASVVLHDDLAIIGAPGRGATGASYGAVYVFRRTPTGWTEEDLILASDPQNTSAFGSSLAFTGSVLAIGAPRGDLAGPGQGAAYLFDFDGLNWVQREKILRPHLDAEFGRLVSVVPTWAFVYSASNDSTIPTSIAAYCIAQDSPCIPTLSTWGVAVLMLLVMIFGAVLLRRRSALTCMFILLPTTVCMGDDPRLSSPHHPEQLLVRFKSGVEQSCKQGVHVEAGATELRRDRYVDGLTLVRVPSEDLARALAMYSSDPDVLYAEPDYIGQVFAEPDDELFEDQWGMQDTGAGIRGPSAWDLWTGDPDFLIAVLDSGVNRQHVDLVGNIWCNPIECPGIIGNYGWCHADACAALGDVNSDGCPGECDVDDDGDGLTDEDSEGREPGDQGYTNDLFEDDDENGYPNDASGWNFNPGTRDPWDVRSDYYHGTHMSGIIGAVGNNSVGVTGVNWNCKIVVLKIDRPLPDQGEIFVSDAIEALDYVIANKIKVSNNSYGWYDGFSQCHYDKILATQEVDHIFVAAAGNEGINNDSDPDPAYPPSYDLDNIISVAGTDDADELGDFGSGGNSNYGETTVDLGAPGVGILSTMSNDVLCCPEAIYLAKSGTSMAAAHVTGVVALMRSLNPQWDFETVKDHLLATTRVPDPALPVATGGVVNAYAAINDCNLNSVPDDEDIAEETSEDCNNNGWPDECDIARGTSLDCDSDGIPEECETLRACCRPEEPFEDCIVTTQACCALDGGFYRPSCLQCEGCACPCSASPQP